MELNILKKYESQWQQILTNISPPVQLTQKIAYQSL